MIYTPFINSVVSLLKFTQTSSQLLWYPYWYEGNPYFYLTGPLVPLLGKFLTAFNLNLTNSYLLIILFSVFLSAIGIYILLRCYKVDNKIAIISAVLYLILPFSYLMLSYQDGLKHISMALMPFLIIYYKQYLDAPALYKIFYIVLLISIIILINSSSLVTVFVALIALILSFVKKDFLRQIIHLVLVLLLTISISSFWYTYGYWLTLIANPSIGGLPLFNVLLFILKGFIQLLPLSFAFWIVKVKKTNNSELRYFSLLFFIFFTLLSVYRFVMDFDFISDWTTFVPEMQFGLVLLIAAFYQKLRKQNTIFRAAIFIILSGLVFFSYKNYKYLNTTYKKQTQFTNQIFDLINKYVPISEKIFLSGSSVFSLNTDFEIKQIRGGNDKASIHRWWAHGAYQIREGRDPRLTYNWLKVLGASYILINDSTSAEYFRDFKNLHKFTNEKYFIKKYEAMGDSLYQVKNTYTARVADKNILKLDVPQDGADADVLTAYSDYLIRPLMNNLVKDNEITFTENTSANEVISLAVTFDTRWKIIKGNGKIISDQIGNLLVIPERPGRQEFLIKYSRNTVDWLLPLITTFMLSVILINFNKIYNLLNLIIIKTHIIGSDDENEY